MRFRYKILTFSGKFVGPILVFRYKLHNADKRTQMNGWLLIQLFSSFIYKLIRQWIAFHRDFVGKVLWVIINSRFSFLECWRDDGEAKVSRQLLVALPCASSRKSSQGKKQWQTFAAVKRCCHIVVWHSSSSKLQHCQSMPLSCLTTSLNSSLEWCSFEISVKPF